jgi:hypothetical protein
MKKMRTIHITITDKEYARFSRGKKAWLSNTKITGGWRDYLLKINAYFLDHENSKTKLKSKNGKRNKNNNKQD